MRMPLKNDQNDAADDEQKKAVGVVGSLGQEEGIDPVSAQGSHSPPRPLILL